MPELASAGIIGKGEDRVKSCYGQRPYPNARNVLRRSGGDTIPRGFLHAPRNANIIRSLSQGSGASSSATSNVLFPVAASLSGGIVAQGASAKMLAPVPPGAFTSPDLALSRSDASSCLLPSSGNLDEPIRLGTANNRGDSGYAPCTRATIVVGRKRPGEASLPEADGRNTPSRRPAAEAAGPGGRALGAGQAGHSRRPRC